MHARTGFALGALLLAALAACSSNDGASASPSALDGGTPPPGQKPGDSNDAGGPPPCSGTPGTFHDQPFASGGETRHYWLHVPASYTCQKPAALIVDFHGTGYGSATDTVEESWATPDLVSASDDLGFIVVRPRSRMKLAGDGSGNFYYQWDIHDGDVALNKTFATELVQDLEQRYNIAPSRIYGTGFSNGPSMAAQFLAEEPSLFHGYGLIAGGLNEDLERDTPFEAATAPRVYTMTGFRDYMLMAKDILDAFLQRNHLPQDHLFNREADTGHEVYGWHFREAFAWMDAGTRPTPGSVAAGWTVETGAAESLVELTTNPAGTVFGFGALGGVFTRSAAGAWSKIASLPSIAPLSDGCFLPDGRGFAVGHGKLAKSDDGTTWAVAKSIPEDKNNPTNLGLTWATSIACTGTRVTAGGVWASAISDDAAATWTFGATDRAFLTTVRAFSNGWLATGYWNYASTSADGSTFTQGTVDGQTQWWNDGALLGDGSAIIVGEGGAIGASADGGTSWSLLSSPIREDLYAVVFRGIRGVAVGAHGAVVLSADGGKSWTSRPSGLDGFLGGVRFLDDTTFVVGGAAGTVLRGSFTSP